MTVWVLSGQVEYEEYAIWGVYSSRELAIAAGDHGPDLMIAVNKSGYSLEIVPKDLDAAAP